MITWSLLCSSWTSKRHTTSCGCARSGKQNKLLWWVTCGMLIFVIASEIGARIRCSCPLHHWWNNQQAMLSTMQGRQVYYQGTQHNSGWHYGHTCVHPADWFPFLQITILCYSSPMHPPNNPSATSICPLCSPSKVKQHQSPLHHLINFTGLNLKEIETVSPVRRSLGYIPTFKTVIPPLKEAALPFTNLTNSTMSVQVYSDSSGFESLE